jgi:hypothetical protein
MRVIHAAIVMHVVVWVEEHLVAVTAMVGPFAFRAQRGQVVRVAHGGVRGGARGSLGVVTFVLARHGIPTAPIAATTTAVTGVDFVLVFLVPLWAVV